jgi:hypothetical protein
LLLDFDAHSTSEEMLEKELLSRLQFTESHPNSSSLRASIVS